MTETTSFFKCTKLVMLCTIDIPINLLYEIIMGVKANYILFFSVDVTYV